MMIYESGGAHSLSMDGVRVDGTISFGRLCGRIGPAFHNVFHFYPPPETCPGVPWITSTHPSPTTRAMALLLQLLLLGLLLRKIQTNNDILQIIPHRTLLDTLTLKWKRRNSRSSSSKSSEASCGHDSHVAWPGPAWCEIYLLAALLCSSSSRWQCHCHVCVA